MPFHTEVTKYFHDGGRGYREVRMQARGSMLRPWPVSQRQRGREKGILSSSELALRKVGGLAVLSGRGPASGYMEEGLLERVSVHYFAKRISSF